jgi:uncharacterized repeat protein (TIGR01451 family)
MKTMNIFNISYLIQSFQKYWICILLIFAYRGVVAQCGFQATCPNTNYLNFGMGSNGDAATIEYDNFVSMFHSTVVRTAYGSYETWGQKLANDGVNNLLSPTEINNTNFPNLTGTILKAHLGSDYVNIGQGIVLTTTGLFAWSDEGAILHPDITTGSVFQKLTINGETDGLPPGINPLDVKMIFTTHGTVALVTCAGDVYVITQFFNNTGAGHTTTLTIAEQTQWYRVRQATSGNPFLTNIVAVRGNRNTLFALKSDGSLWTWGSETYLGNNTAHAARNYATSMTIPTPDPIKMIGVTRDNSNSRPSYYVLNANGNLYSMGHNARKQLGDWTVTERLQWVQPKYTSSSGPVMNNIHWISTNEHDSRYAAINVLNIDSTNYNWGDANGQMLGRGGTGTFDPGIPNGISISDKVLAVETGGHTSMLIKKCEDFFGYVGHRISGSMGDGTNASTNESTYTFNTAVVYICGATTAEISLSGTPEFGTNGRYCNESTAELTVYPPGGTLSVISGSGSLSGNFLTFSGMGNDTVTIRYVVSVPGCPIPDTAYLDLLTEDCYFPSWKLTKTAQTTTYSTVGEVINYSIELENTGNVSIGSVVVTDILATTGPTYDNGDNNHNDSLDINEIWIYSATRNITQNDLDFGSFTNTANVTGIPYRGNLTDTFDIEIITANQNPSIEIIKTAVPTAYSTLGEEVEYSFVVNNTGNVTLTNVEVTDPLFGLTFGPVTLAPGTSQTYNHTYTVTQMALDTGSVYNVASVTSEDTNGNPIEDSDDETISANQNPSIDLIKSALPELYSQEGDEIEYTFTVNNTGNVTLTNVIVSDPLFNITFGPVTLSPNESESYTFTYEITQIDLDLGSVFNEASVSGFFNGTEYPATDDATITAIQNPGLNLVKTALPQIYSQVGEEIEYSFQITNTGNVTLENIDVFDPLFSLHFTCLTLAPGQVETYTYTYNVTQEAIDTGYINNIASSHFVFDSKDYYDSDDETITAHQNPSIEIIKTAVPATYSTLGEEVEYSFVVNNTGNVTLTNAEVTDPLFGLTFGPVTLAPGTSQTYTHTYTVTQMALDTGSVYNVASVSSEDTNGNQISDYDDEVIVAIQSPNLELLKSALPTSYSTLGEEVEYSFVVNNTGNVTLTNAEVTDPLFRTELSGLSPWHLVQVRPTPIPTRSRKWPWIQEVCTM